MCQAQARGSVAPSCLALLSCSVSPSCSFPSTLLLHVSGSTAGKAQLLDVETALIILQSGYCSVKLLTAGSISICASTRVAASIDTDRATRRSRRNTVHESHVALGIGAMALMWQAQARGSVAPRSPPLLSCSVSPSISFPLTLILRVSGSTAGKAQLLDVETALIILQSGYCSVKLLTAGSISTCASPRVELISPQMSRHQSTRTGPHAGPAATRCTSLMWRSV